MLAGKLGKLVRLTCGHAGGVRLASDGELIVRVLVGFALAFLIGFEREVRGARAGDRTFAVIGTASAAIASVTGPFSPQALAGIVTGVGFIGAGLILRAPDEQRLHGVTTAATVVVST